MFIWGKETKLLTGFSHFAWAILYINTLIIILINTRVYTYRYIYD
jgi:hypothetical protein